MSLSDRRQSEKRSVRGDWDSAQIRTPSKYHFTERRMIHTHTNTRTHTCTHTDTHANRHTQTHLTLKSDTRRMWRTSWTVPFYTCRSKDFLVSILHLSAGFWRWSARVPGSRFTEGGPAAGQSSDPGRLYRERSVRHHLHTGQNSGILTLSGGETAGQEGRSLTTR